MSTDDGRITRELGRPAHRLRESRVHLEVGNDHRTTRLSNGRLAETVRRLDDDRTLGDRCTHIYTHTKGFQ